MYKRQGENTSRNRQFGAVAAKPAARLLQLRDSLKCRCLEVNYWIFTKFGGVFPSKAVIIFTAANSPIFSRVSSVAEAI